MIKERNNIQKGILKNYSRFTKESPLDLRAVVGYSEKLIKMNFTKKTLPRQTFIFEETVEHNFNDKQQLRTSHLKLNVKEVNRYFKTRQTTQPHKIFTETWHKTPRQ